MKKMYYRTYQKALEVGSKFLNWREPKVVEGENSFYNDLPDLIQKKDLERLLIVTDEGIKSTGILEPFFQSLKNKNIKYSLFDQVVPNPPITIIEQIAIKYKKNYSQAIISIGGGSVIDAAKAAGILINKPQKNVADFRGLLKVFHDIPPLFAVPTTAGTGSEATLAAVVTDPGENEKYAIMDPHLIPDYAVLDPKLTQSLPENLTAETGMDALTHAVEAYIGNSNTNKTKNYAKKSVELIDNYLYRSYQDGNDLDFRAKMLAASYYAGVAFTRAYVGNVHAISHALTAFYGVPHGRTNATILPIILRIYGEESEEKLSELADYIDLTPVNYSNHEKAQAFIKWVEGLNNKMEIPESIPEIREEDLDAIAEHAGNEANPLYPVPKIFSHGDFVEALKVIKG